jgi:hypothetical protein
LVHHAGSFGTKTGTVAIDMPAVRQRKRAMVEDLKALTLQQYQTAAYLRATLVSRRIRFLYSQ